jgi:hypothetical protein
LKCPHSHRPNRSIRKQNMQWVRYLSFCIYQANLDSIDKHSYVFFKTVNPQEVEEFAKRSSKRARTQPDRLTYKCWPDRKTNSNIGQVRSEDASDDGGFEDASDDDGIEVDEENNVGDEHIDNGVVEDDEDLSDFVCQEDEEEMIVYDGVEDDEEDDDVPEDDSRVIMEEDSEEEVDRRPERFMPSYNEKWDEMFEQLRAYERAHGHCYVSYDAEDHVLYKWCCDQIRRCTIPERRTKLIDLGFDFTPIVQIRIPGAWETSMTLVEQLRGVYDLDEEQDKKPFRVWLLHKKEKLYDFVRFQSTRLYWDHLDKQNRLEACIGEPMGTRLWLAEGSWVHNFHLVQTARAAYDELFNTYGSMTMKTFQGWLKDYNRELYNWVWNYQTSNSYGKNDEQTRALEAFFDYRFRRN